MSTLIVYRNQQTYKDDYKGIYSINFDNGKRYIGLSNKVKERLWEHYKDADEGDILPVHGAMRNHTFTFELLENCENLSRKELCKREIYWIAFYNTYKDKTKGYNLTPGGDGAAEGCDNPQAKLNEQQLKEVYNKLLNCPNLYIYQIAAQYNISPNAISNINLGKTYYNEFLTYPLRSPQPPKVKNGVKNHLALFSQDVFDNIINDLKDTTFSLQEISKKYHCSYTTISKINRGLSYYNDFFDYPIRKTAKFVQPKEKIIEIYQDLIFNDKLSMKKISLKYNISYDTVLRLNQGSTYSFKDYTYPLRANKEINKAVSTIHESVEQGYY